LKSNTSKKDAYLDELSRQASLSGASRAAILSTNDISAENDLANLCREPQCRNYGLSAGCPPHASGPSRFRKLLKKIQHAIVVRFDVPASILFSDQRREIFKLLHEIVAGVEQSAIEMDFSHSQAFAGSSCKRIFCHEYASCRVISNKGKCRNPQSASPSMSGYGIKVSKLMISADWSSKINMRKEETENESISWVAGLVLIG
jgi:predicted metal-binding protein